MKVYRVEDSLGRGPYQTKDELDSEILWAMSDEHNSEELRDSHPSIVGDIGYWYEFKEFHLCAFQTLEMLYKWFDKWLEKILPLGFRIVEIEVPSEFVLNCRLQCGFDGREIQSKRLIQK